MTQVSNRSRRATVPAWLRIALGMFAITFGANLFAPLLPVMREVHGLTQAHVAFLFAVYIVGLVPALILGGPASDRMGRRAMIRPSLLLSAVGTLVTIAAHFFPETLSPYVLVVARLLTGAAVGLVLAAGASWLKEVTPTADGPGVGARRATVAMSAGFGVGPLVTGPVAEWLPGPDVTGLVIHLVMVLGLTPLVWSTPAAEAPRGTQRSAGPRVGQAHSSPALFPATAGSRPFLLGVAIWAPWVFGCATTAFTALAPIAAAGVNADVAYTGLIAGITMLTGAAIQPVIGRYAGRGRAPHPAVIGLATATAGMLASVLVAALPSAAAMWVMLPTAVILGAGYGILMVSGLRETQRLAAPHELGGLTGIFYALTYIGFFVPWVIALVAPHLGYGAVFGLGAAVAAASLVIVAVTHHRAAPGR
jgi:MFS family permease